MRDRILTPFFPLCCGLATTEAGVESPGRPGRSLEGCLVDNGRYLLRRKTGHSRTTVRYAAHDLVGGIELDLYLHPDPEAAEGYRLGRTGVVERRDLPDLCAERFDQTGPRLPALSSPEEGVFRRAWRRIRSLLAA